MSVHPTPEQERPWCPNLRPAVGIGLAIRPHTCYSSDIGINGARKDRGLSSRRRRLFHATAWSDIPIAVEVEHEGRTQMGGLSQQVFF